MLGVSRCTGRQHHRVLVGDHLARRPTAGRVGAIHRAGGVGLNDAAVGRRKIVVASQRAQGFMTFFGGVVIYFAKDILDMIL